MWKTKLEEIKNLNSRFGERINDGATDEDIKILLENMLEIFKNHLQTNMTTLLWKAEILEVLYSLMQTLSFM